MRYRESAEVRERVRIVGRAYRQTDSYKKKARNNKLKQKYNVTEEWYNAELLKQNSKCAICGALEKEATRNRLCVDHNHHTGQVRGLLCAVCNHQLPIVEETARLERAQEYLRKYESKSNKSTTRSNS